MPDDAGPVASGAGPARDINERVIAVDGAHVAADESLLWNCFEAIRDFHTVSLMPGT
jgi:hypothetical protein